VTSVTGYSTDFAFYNVTCIIEGPKIFTVDNVTSMAELLTFDNVPCMTGCPTAVTPGNVTSDWMFTAVIL